MPAPRQLDAWTAATLLARRELSAVDLLHSCIDRVNEREPQVHAFAALQPEAAMARALDAAALQGPLHGLPLGVKDLFDTTDLPTTCGSAVYAGHQSASDAASVALCREAGALVLGKTVTTEFAYFHPGATRNPVNLAYTPGGSSSGSAAAVADHMLPLALGSQTAGSIIRPAAYCGVVGYKPSWGRVPRAGVKSLSETLDVVGGFGRSVRDVALLGQVLTGDRRLVEAVSGELDACSPAPRIGLCRTPLWDQVDADTQRAWGHATAALAPGAGWLGELPWPEALPDLVALQKAVMFYEMARALSHERLQHRARLSERLTRLLDEGMAIDGRSHAANLALTAQASRQIDSVFTEVDVLLAPSATGEAPAGIGATGDPMFCRGWTLLGLPSIHLPFATGSHGLPIGLQVVGRHGDDHRLMAAAHWIHAQLLMPR